MAIHNTLNELFTNIANGVREINDKTEKIVADNFPSELEEINQEVVAQNSLISQLKEQINSLPNIEDQYALQDQLLDGTAAIYTNDRIITLRDYAFVRSPALQEVNFPNCTSVGVQTFYYCPSLTDANFEKATSIGIQAFYGCSSLENVNIPECQTIDVNAFANCTALSQVSFPKCETVGNYAFLGCTSLKTISFPECTTMGLQVFYGCSELENVELPNCENIGIQTFYNCDKLQTVSLPKCTQIDANAFANSASLISIYLTSPTLCTLSNSNAFFGTRITQSTGSIYVPAEMVNAYKTATNWSYYSAVIKPIRPEID